MEWEKQYLEASLTDLSEFFKDLQLMRAMGPVGEYIKGINIASKARKEVDKASERLTYMRQAHSRLMDKLQKSSSRLAGQVNERHRDVSVT
jgi:signal recognition particle GTPase